MYRFANLTALLLVVQTFAPALFAQDDWARWRGPNGNGIAVADQKIPLKWDASTNVVWKTRVPGRGHASPIVVGDKIFLATADEDQQTQSVVCHDRNSGDRLWETVVNKGELNPKIHDKNTHASSTVAVVGEHVVCVFNNHDSVQATALGFGGEQIWQKNLGSYEPRHRFGFGSTPIGYGNWVIVTNENLKNARVVALEVTSGDEVWEIDRESISSYSTPVIADVGGQQQLLLSGGSKVASYDPDNGKELWSCPASWQVTCGTLVWDKSLKLVFASGGYPTQETLAINAKSGKKVWGNSTKCYEQSMIVLDGHLYGYAEKGVIICWDAKNGTEKWKHRFEGPESASPVAVGEHIMFTSEKGGTLVIRANPEKFEQVVINRLGDETFASMAVCGNQIFTRVAFNEAGKRQEWLYCLGE